MDSHVSWEKLALIVFLSPKVVAVLHPQSRSFSVHYPAIGCFLAISIVVRCSTNVRSSHLNISWFMCWAVNLFATVQFLFHLWWDLLGVLMPPCEVLTNRACPYPCSHWEFHLYDWTGAKKISTRSPNYFSCQGVKPAVFIIEHQKDTALESKYLTIKQLKTCWDSSDRKSNTLRTIWYLFHTV